MNDEILVSIIVCSRNEEKYIYSCLESLINQKNVPGNFEILVIDGMSEDNTGRILSDLADKAQGKIRLFDNPSKIKPPAVNIGFKNSRGRYIAICDAHTIYDKEYIASLVKLITEHTEAICVGGPIISIGESDFGKASALAMSSYIGVGNPKHRFPDYEGYAEMACFPLFRREVLDLVGLYDERLIRNQDDEYCYRIRKAGGKIYLSPIAKSFYYVRNSPGKLFSQYFSYGLWHIATLKKHKETFALRQLVPAVFFTSVASLLILGLVIGNLWVAFSLPILYLSVLLAASLPIFFKRSKKICLLYTSRCV